MVVLWLGDNQPLKARSPLSLVVLPVINIFLILLASFSQLFSVSECEASLLLQYFFFILLVNYYIQRTTILLFRFKLVDERIQLYELLIENKDLSIDLPTDDIPTQTNSLSSRKNAARPSINSKVNMFANDPKKLKSISTRNITRTMSSNSGLEAETSQLETKEEEEKIPITFWYLQHSFVVRSWFRFLFFCIVGFVAFLPAIIDYGVRNGDFSKNGNCYFPVSMIVLRAYYIIFVVAALLLALLLRKAEFAENFGIRRELLKTLLGLILIHIPYMIWLEILYVKESSFSFTELELVRMFFVAITTTYFICYDPAFKAYYKQEKFLNRIRTEEPGELARSTSKRNLNISTMNGDFGKTENMKELEDYLSSRTGFKMFAKFAKSEFCVENVLFWREVQKYLNLIELCTSLPPEKARAVIQREAEQIYLTFVIPNGPLQVNISYANSFLISQTLGLDHTFAPENAKVAQRAFEGTFNSIATNFSLVRGSVFSSIPTVGTFLTPGNSKHSKGGTLTAIDTTESKQTNSKRKDKKIPSFFMQATKGNDTKKETGMEAIEEIEQKEENKKKVPMDDLKIIFDAALLEVVKLLSFDIFRRYKITAEYKRFASKKRRQKSMGNALKAMEMV